MGNELSKRGLTVRAFFSWWFGARRVRNNASERGMFVKHVESRAWFVAKRLRMVVPRDVQRLFIEITADSALAPKSVHNLFGVVRNGFRKALREGFVSADPCILDRGIVSRKTREQRPYALDEVARLVDPSLVGSWQAVWNSLGFFTGMRMGEICGRKWRDWMRDSLPLTGLDVATQYDDQVLKTDRPRRVPVHECLERVLRAWWESGFELHYGRKPTGEDFICPDPRCAEVPVRNKNQAYRLWRSAASRAGVENHREHAVRHTFITHARRGGARGSVLAKATHNAAGEVIDIYTHWEWEPLCEAVSCFPTIGEPVPLELVPVAPVLRPRTFSSSLRELLAAALVIGVVPKGAY